MSRTIDVATLMAAATRQWVETLALETREARIEARVLISHALKVDQAWLIGHDRDPLTAAQHVAIQNLLARRAAGEPIAYITGEREFFGLNFRVSPAVLIPRPDTETLVEIALQRLPENKSSRVLDLGTGSGAVAIALARLRPLSEVLAVDASADALAVAQANAYRLGTANVRCIVSDWYAGLDPLAVKEFDIIVSNPPYIAADDPHLSLGDLCFEPMQALASGQDGLRDLRLIIAGASAHLNKQGWLLLEHGFEQAGAVLELLRLKGFEQTFTTTDLAGLDRVSGGCWPGVDYEGTQAG